MNVEKKNMQEEDMLRKKGKNCEFISIAEIY